MIEDRASIPPVWREENQVVREVQIPGRPYRRVCKVRRCEEEMSVDSVVEIPTAAREERDNNMIGTYVTDASTIGCSRLRLGCILPGFAMMACVRGLPKPLRALSVLSVDHRWRVGTKCLSPSCRHGQLAKRHQGGENRQYGSGRSSIVGIQGVQSPRSELISSNLKYRQGVPHKVLGIRGKSL